MPRFRMFAGPNGSGKTTLFNYLKKKKFIHTEVYVNADRIEKELVQSMVFNFNAYRVKVSDDEFKKHILSSGMMDKLKTPSVLTKIQIESGKLKLNMKSDKLNSYIASFIATYLARKLIETKQSFCYETVLSHPSKFELIKLARKQGYKTYLYFVFLNNKELNVERVEQRVKEDGHDVDDEKIKDRYPRSLRNFEGAAKLSNIAYLIDNSKEFEEKAVLKEGKVISIAPDYPAWLREYYSPRMKK
jgi:predicted ABC-type ATPase